MSKRPIEAADIFKIRLVSDPQVSPDGSTVAYTVTDSMRRRTATGRQSGSRHCGGEPQRLTSGMRRDGQPRWSPDGATLAFTSRPEAGRRRCKGQIWTLRVAGGEPARLTRWPKASKNSAGRRTALDRGCVESADRKALSRLRRAASSARRATASTARDSWTTSTASFSSSTPPAATPAR